MILGGERHWIDKATVEWWENLQVGVLGVFVAVAVAVTLPSFSAPEVMTRLL